MQLEGAQKELVAIGASIGAGCRPCIEHHLPAAREQGLSAAEVAEAVAYARAVRAQAMQLFSSRVDELLGRDAAAPGELPGVGSPARELVAIGVSVGANSHALLSHHVRGGLEAGLTASQIEAALNTSEYVQRRAAEITADRASLALAHEKDRLERTMT